MQGGLIAGLISCLAVSPDCFIRKRACSLPAPTPPPHAPALSVMSSDTRVQADVSGQSACNGRGISCSPGVSPAWVFPSLSLAGPAVMTDVAWTPQWGHGWGSPQLLLHF